MSVGSPTGSAERTTSSPGSFCARASASASSKPQSRSHVSKIQSGYDSLSGPSGSDVDERREALGEPPRDRVRERRSRARAAPRGRARPRRRRPRAAGASLHAELVARDRAAPRARPGRACAPGRRPSSSIPWSIVRTRCTVPYAIRWASARSRGSSPAAAAPSARSAYASSSKTRRTTSNAARRAGAITADAAEELVVGHAPLALGLHLVRDERAVLEPRAPDRDAAAVRASSTRRCAARARGRAATRRAGRRGRARGRRPRSSRRRSTPSSGCGSNVGVGSTPSSSRAATSAERAKIGPASSSGPIGNASCAAIGPASSAATVSWIVTPVSSSPARIARSTGAAPRQRGSSDGCTLSHSARSSSDCGISRPYAQTTIASTGSLRQLRPLGLEARRSRAARRPPSRRRRELAAAAARRVGPREQVGDLVPRREPLEDVGAERSRRGDGEPH